MKDQKMLYNLYSIKDTKMGFQQIFILPNNAAAIRWFGDACQNKESPYNKHPEDYQLFKVGTINEDTGELVSETAFLENASSFFNSK